MRSIIIIITILNIILAAFQSVGFHYKTPNINKNMDVERGYMYNSWYTWFLCILKVANLKGYDNCKKYRLNTSSYVFESYGLTLLSPPGTLKDSNNICLSNFKLSLIFSSSIC